MGKFIEIGFLAINVTIGLFISIAVFAIIAALPLFWLWNWLMPEFFGLAEVSIWQALGFLVLSGVLFKSNSSS